MICSNNFLFHFVNVRHTSFHTPTASLAEQVGQEILANLHSDREKIQRARERVSAHVSVLIARETLENVRTCKQHYHQSLVSAKDDMGAPQSKAY